MKYLVLSLLCMSSAIVSQQDSNHVFKIHFSNNDKVNGKVFFSSDLQGWKIIEPQCECKDNTYMIVGAIILGTLVGLAGAYLLKRHLYPNDPSSL